MEFEISFQKTVFLRLMFAINANNKSIPKSKTFLRDMEFNRSKNVKIIAIYVKDI
jgi:hypothetical protein